MEPVDILVIGAGVAGLTAAATAARGGASVLVLDRLGAGGQVVTVDRIENMPGFPDPVSGIEVGPAMQEQAEAWGAEFRLTEVASVVAAPEGGYIVETGDGPVSCRALIVAAGSSRRRIGLPGEVELAGRGVSHCASCDGPLFRGAAVVVMGGGDSAFDEAAVLAQHAATVTLAYRGDRPRAQVAAVERVRAMSNVVEMPGHELTAIEGGDRVTGLRLRGAGGETVVPAEGLFVYVGLVPNTGFLNGVVPLDAEGRIVTGPDLSAAPALYAAGDIRSGATGLLASAIGDGATAAVAAMRHLGTRD